MKAPRRLTDRLGLDSAVQDVHVGHDQDLLQGHPFVINAPHHAPLAGSEYG